MPYPDYETTSIRVLLDLEDERRDKKPWLPASDKDVSEGRVFLLFGLPGCRTHGAMLCVSQEGHIWRCGELHCGVGAVYRKR